MRLLSIHINFAEHGELSTILGCKLLYLLLSARLLVSELVAWEREDFETFVSILQVDLGQLLVVFGGQTSEARNVNYKDRSFTFTDLAQ